MLNGPSKEPTGYLNGLRALAAMTVLIGHCIIWSATYPRVTPGTAAKLSVDLFMMLSGFLMVYTTDQSTRWRYFYFRRFARIAPAYYISLAFAVLFSSSFFAGYAFLAERNGLSSYFKSINLQYTFDNILVHAAFVFGLIPKYASSTLLPDWSLSLEMQFYAAFPLLLAVWRRIGSTWFALISIASMYASAHAIYPSFPEASFLPFKLPLFVAGMLICDYAQRPQGGALITILVVLLTLSQQYYYGLATCTWVLAAGLLMLTMSRPDDSSVLSLMKQCLNVVLDNRMCKVFADISYSTYLLHGFFISIVGRQLFESGFLDGIPYSMQASTFTVVISILTIAAAAVVHTIIERPVNAAASRFVNQKS